MSGRGRIRVLHCIQNLNYGGMERVLADLVEGVDPERFEPHVLTLEYRGRYGEGLDRVATLHDGPPQGPLSMLWPRRLVATLRTIAPDVVHVHSGVWFKVARAARKAGVPLIVYTEHGRVGPETVLSRTLDRWAARWTDRIVAVSEATAAQLRDGPGISSDAIRVVHNGIDTGRFHPGPSDVRETLGIGPDEVLLGAVGRLEPVKDHQTLVRALGIVVNEDEVEVPVRLVLAGDGSLRGELEALVESLGLRDHVIFLGWWDDPEGLLRALDLFVLPSLSEGTSISLLEALSTGVCPLVTRVGGNPDVLGPGLAHRLVPSGDPEALARGIALACRDPETRRADGREGRRRVEQAFDVRSMVEAYAKIYAGG